MSGPVEITQATENGNYSGNVSGTIYSTGSGSVTQIVALKGLIHSDSPVPIEIPFEVNMAIDNSWKGTGGFCNSNVHIKDIPVTPES